MKRCEKCGFTTEDLEIYRQHRVDHALGKVNDALPVPTKPTEIAFIPKVEETTEIPTPPSKSAKEILEEKKQPSPQQPPKQAVKPATQPVRLRYKYEGVCKKCGNEVETLYLDVEEKYVVVAFCNSCHEQIMSRPVAKL